MPDCVLADMRTQDRRRSQAWRNRSILYACGTHRFNNRRGVRVAAAIGSRVAARSRRVEFPAMAVLPAILQVVLDGATPEIINDGPVNGVFDLHREEQISLSRRNSCELDRDFQL